MSRFLSPRYRSLEAYTPGEQPRDQKYVKLNTNESPFPPTERVRRAVAEEGGRLQLYCDPECTALREKAAALYGVGPQNILPVNGSDEILYFAFLTFCGPGRPMAFPSISYGFYPVYAAVTGTPAHEIPLKEDFSIDWHDYCNLGENLVIANPNAPTGMLLSVSEIEQIVKSNRENLVVIDEAYIDFGGESCVPLVRRYDNLLVTATFSKSRSLAGARLGFGIGCEALIRDLNTIKYSVNPYNINRMTQAAGIAAIEDNALILENCCTVIENRAYAAEGLRARGFRVLPSASNFLFAAHSRAEGGALYRALREKGVLVRHFDRPEITNFLRITVGTREQMDFLLQKLDEILKETEAAQ